MDGVSVAVVCSLGFDRVFLVVFIFLELVVVYSLVVSSLEENGVSSAAVTSSEKGKIALVGFDFVKVDDAGFFVVLNFLKK